MKRIFIHLGLICLLLTNMVDVQAQSVNCPGLKNPVAFGMYSNYSGQRGSRESGFSTYQTQYLQMTSAVIPFIQMATTVGGKTSPYCIAGNDDNNIFVIKNTGTDPHTLNRLSYTPPSDTSFIKSIRLGNCYGGAEAEGLYYTMQVTPENALVFLNYAIVLYNALHGINDNPEFIIRVKKESYPGSGVFTDISDTLCYIVHAPTSSNNLGTWQNTGGSGGAHTVYKPWTKVAINLSNYVYQTVRIEVYVGDCAYSAHYGYCYIAGECQPMKLYANDCAPGNVPYVATIKAPKGLDAYRWQRKNSLGNWEDIAGATDSILYIQTTDFYINPDGNRNTCNDFKCIMTTALDPAKPYETWLQTTVCNKNPHVYIDVDVEDCNGTILVVDRSIIPYHSSSDDIVDTSLSVWDFGDGSDAVVGGSVRHVYANPGEYVVTLHTSAANGECYAEGSKTVKIRDNFDTIIYAAICDNEVYTENGFNETEAGTYVHTSQSVLGCDSIITLELTVNPTYNEVIFDTIFTDTGVDTTYYEIEILQTVNGCDSVKMRHVTVINQMSVRDIEEDVLSKLEIYPNPTSGIIIINNDNVKKIEVLDVEGRILSGYKNTNTIDISKYGKGVYTLRIELPEGVVVRKVVRK